MFPKASNADVDQVKAAPVLAPMRFLGMIISSNFVSLAGRLTRIALGEVGYGREVEFVGVPSGASSWCVGGRLVAS